MDDLQRGRVLVRVDSVALDGLISPPERPEDVPPPQPALVGARPLQRPGIDVGQHHAVELVEGGRGQGLVGRSVHLATVPRPGVS